MRKLWLVLAVLLSACATARDVTVSLDRLIGQPSVAAIRQFGPPDSSYTTDGSTWHKWRYTGAYYGASAPLTCEWSVEVNGGKIVATDWKGNEAICVQQLVR